VIQASTCVASSWPAPPCTCSPYASTGGNGALGRRQDRPAGHHSHALLQLVVMDKDCRLNNRRFPMINHHVLIHLDSSSLLINFGITILPPGTRYSVTLGDGTLPLLPWSTCKICPLDRKR
jgi:hypothetical protein